MDIRLNFDTAPPEKRKQMISELVGHFFNINFSKIPSNNDEFN